MRKKLTLLALLCGACGCNVSKAYVEADRATYEAVGVDYVRYVNADAKLTEEQKDRRIRTVVTWRVRLEAAEKNQ